MPQGYDSQLGEVIYIDEGGVIANVGSMFDDAYFNRLVEQSTHTLDRTVTEEEYPDLTAAFVTGHTEIKTLTNEECIAYVPKFTGSVALNNW